MYITYYEFAILSLVWRLMIIYTQLFDNRRCRFVALTNNDTTSATHFIIDLRSLNSIFNFTFSLYLAICYIQECVTPAGSYQLYFLVGLIYIKRKNNTTACISFVDERFIITLQ